VSRAAQIDRTLAALSDPTRRRVVDLLKKKPRRAGELAAHLDMTPPAMSRHLRVLRKSGLIEEEAANEEDLRARTYKLRRAPFAELEKWLEGVAEMWSDQLAAFKAHVEKRESVK